MAKIYYYHLDEALTKLEVLNFLTQSQQVYNLPLQEIIPDKITLG